MSENESGIRLEFAQFGHFDSFDIIRSMVSMASVADEDLPTPIATGLKTMYFVDKNVLLGATYFYKVRVHRGSESFLSEEIGVLAIPPSHDEHWPNVSSLLHFDGTDNSTLFIDETGLVWNGTGNPLLKISEKVFGQSSIYFDGASSLKVADNTKFSYGSGQFTWECFIRLNSTSGNQYIFDHSSGSGNAGTLSYYDNKLRFYNQNTGIYGDLYTAGPSLAPNTWHHVAVVRDATMYTTIYVDGVTVATGYDNLNYNNSEIWIGRYAGSAIAYFSGYIDEVRITKGVARYISDFTPPDKQFPSM